jgi:cytochrome c peroxidase
MKRAETQWSALLRCVGIAVLAFLVNVSSVAAQSDDNGNGQNNNGRGDDDHGAFAVPQGPGTNTGNCPAPPPPTDEVVFPKVYCPYPPGIIPTDLTQESERVRREIRGIEQQALADLAALGPLMPTSPNQVLAGNGVLAVQVLGKLENYDENLSVFKNVACAFCHMPYAGFSGPIPSLNKTTVAYPGSFHYRFGKRKPQSYDYSPYYPPLQYNLTQANFYGGNFWDLRATGYKLRSPDAEQSQWPPLDTQEMGNPDFGCVVFRLSQARYRRLFEGIWGNQSFDIDWPDNTERVCRTPGGAFGSDPTPLHLSPKDRGTASSTFNAYADSISAFEQGPEVSPFSSKFDAFLAGTPGVTLTADEMAGYNLFRGKGNCNSCHLDGRSTAPSTQLAPNGVDTGAAADVQPLFTDTTSSNLGLPKPFPYDPIYYENKPDSFGFTPNPAGADFKDLGVGLFLRSQSGVNPNSNWTGFAPAFDGFMQVATARDVDLRPKPDFVKAYMHNGYLKSLKEVVHFYNTRDRADYAHPAAIGGCPPGFTEKINCWPLPEVPQTKDMTVGNLGLTDTEENQIVAFLKTLTDGFTTPFPNANTYTGP